MVKKTESAKRTPPETNFRILALDLSLSPGIAALEVRGRTPFLLACSSVATSTADTDAVRNYTVETFVAAFLREHRPFDIVVREDFTSGRNKRATQTIFSAWAAADRALAAYGYQAEDLKPALSPTSVKKYVTGSGKAEKPEVAEAVWRYLRLPDGYKWRTGYDDADACAVGLSYLLRENMIDEIGGIAA
ncbi:crossover junction endodeoxyribonuclease RuvC [Paenibacillus sp. FSL R7-0128]|uniref:crossover junction endodeoxyribonuclease RuvC n=1 Tax=Paenibacillus sp. FSL R7-0128 TaxID=2954529 RepID=UPI0030F64AAE